DDNFSVLKLTCFDYANLKESFDDHQFNLILNSSHCFIIVIEVKNTDNVLNSGEIVSTLETSLCGNKKYFMINLCNAKLRETFLYYQGEVKHIDNDDSERDKYIQNFIRGSLMNQSILDCTLSLLTIKKNIEHAISDDDPLFLRLLLAFNVKHEKEFLRNTLQTLIKHCSVHTLASFLDLPIVDLGCSYPPTQLIEEAVQYTFTNGEQILSVAALENDSDVVSMLLRVGAEVEHLDNKGKNACDYALEGKRDENLKLLIENDARFPLAFEGKMPADFETSQSNVKKEIFEIYQQRVNFHESIINSINEENDTETVIKEYRSTNPSTKFAFTLSEKYPYSKSIIATALEHKHYAVYASLVLHDFAQSNNDKEIIGNLREQENETINALLQEKFTRCNLWEIRYLISNTRIGFGVEHNEYSKYWEIIKSVYKYLNSIEDICGILKIVEHSKALSIVVDFKNKSVNMVDHTTNEGPDGITHNFSGRIFVSAVGKSKEELSGVVIHELCH
ncbi:CLUMA_CG012982, isoform A, partial [Clunio marinus]